MSEKRNSTLRLLSLDIGLDSANEPESVQEKVLSCIGTHAHHAYKLPSSRREWILTKYEGGWEELGTLGTWGITWDRKTKEVKQ